MPSDQSSKEVTPVRRCPPAGRRFVVAWCAGVLAVVLVLFPLATVFLINWFDDAEGRWINEIRARKFQIAKAVTSRERILIVGGSSGLFGIDAELLGVRLG